MKVGGGKPSRGSVPWQKVAMQNRSPMSPGEARRRSERTTEWELNALFLRPDFHQWMKKKAQQETRKSLAMCGLFTFIVGLVLGVLGGSQLHRPDSPKPLNPTLHAFCPADAQWHPPCYFDREREELNQKIAALMDEKRVLHEVVRNLEAEFQDVELSMETFMAKLRSCSREADQLKSQLNACNTKCTNTASDLETALTANQACSQRVSEAEEKLVDCTSHFSECQKKLDEQTEVVKRVRDDLSLCQTGSAALQRDFNVCSEIRDSLEKTMGFHTGKHEDLEREIKSKVDKQLEIESELTACMANKSAVDEQLVTLGTQMEKFGQVTGGGLVLRPCHVGTDVGLFLITIFGALLLCWMFSSQATMYKLRCNVVERDLKELEAARHHRKKR